LLDLLEPDIGGQVQAATLQTIVCALVDEWDNIRVDRPLCSIDDRPSKHCQDWNQLQVYSRERIPVKLFGMFHSVSR